MPATIDAKVCLLGFHQSGKTALFNRVVYDEFGKTSLTINAYFNMISERNINVSLWDTAGHERFSALTQFYMRDAHIIILVADPTSENFEKQLQYLSSHLDGATPTHGFLLVATKSDLVTPENQALVDANIEAFHKKFAKETDPKPLFVSVKKDNPKSLLERIFERLAVNNPVNNSTKVSANVDRPNATIFDSLQDIESKLRKRVFKPDPSRFARLRVLKSALEQCESDEEIKAALVEEARFLRTPDENGRYRYGINFGFTRFKFFVHLNGYGYEHSEFYQFLKKQLFKVDPSCDLAKESEPKSAVAEAAAPEAPVPAI